MNYLKHLFELYISYMKLALIAMALASVCFFVYSLALFYSSPLVIALALLVLIPFVFIFASGKLNYVVMPLERDSSWFFGILRSLMTLGGAGTLEEVSDYCAAGTDDPTQRENLPTSDVVDWLFERPKLLESLFVALQSAGYTTDDALMELAFRIARFERFERDEPYSSDIDSSRLSYFTNLAKKIEARANFEEEREAQEDITSHWPSPPRPDEVYSTQDLRMVLEIKLERTRDFYLGRRRRHRTQHEPSSSPRKALRSNEFNLRYGGDISGKDTSSDDDKDATK